MSVRRISTSICFKMSRLIRSVFMRSRNSIEGNGTSLARRRDRRCITTGRAVIERIELIDRLLTAGKPVTFRVRGMLYSGEQEMNIEFFVNRERKGRSQVTRHSGDFVETEFIYTPESPGWYSVYGIVNDGRFEPGEIRRIVMHVPRKAQVVIAGDSPADFYFPAKALNPDPDRSAFSIRKVLSVDLTPTDITQADVVVLSGVSSISDNLYKTLLTSVVERGMGLIVFASSQMSKSLYDDGIFRDMFPVSVEKRLSLDGNKSGNIAVIDWFDISHPILAGVSRGGDFQKPEVISYVKMRPQGKIRVIARFNDGSMAVGDTFCSKGRVVVFAVAPSISDSELPLTGIFVPLFIRAVQYLSETEITGNMYVTDDIVKEKVGNASVDATVSIKPEDSPARLVEVVPGEGGVFIQGEIASEPGFNSVYAGKEERARYSVDIPVSEIMFERESVIKLSETFNTVNWKVVDESENLSELILNDRYGTELFGLFIILAGLLLVVEMIISKRV
ncbi:hypothetical protein ES703_107707 [subsurface metagenome]